MSATRPHRKRATHYHESAAFTSLLLGALIAVDTSRVRADEQQPPAPPADSAPLDFASARLTLEQNCADCHGTEEGEGGFSLTSVTDEASLGRHHETWARIRQRLADRSMPPADAEPLEISL